MHSARMRRLAAALAMLMLISCFGGTALAAGGKIGDKTASPTVLTDANRDTTVTLRLPSEEYKNKVEGEEYDYLRFTILKDYVSYKAWYEQLKKIPESQLKSIKTVDELNKRINQ